MVSYITNYSLQWLRKSFVVGESFANKGVIWKQFETNHDVFENMFKQL